MIQIKQETKRATDAMRRFPEADILGARQADEATLAN